MNDPFNLALAKLQRYCALEDRCSFQIRQKLVKEKELSKMDKEQLLELLIVEGFVDNQRFASAFVRGKFRIKKWGRNKLTSELIARHIDSKEITIALKEIEEDSYIQTAQELLTKKKRETDDPFKLFRFMYQKGYESEIINSLIYISPK